MSAIFSRMPRCRTIDFAVHRNLISTIFLLSNEEKLQRRVCAKWHTSNVSWGYTYRSVPTDVAQAWGGWRNESRNTRMHINSFCRSAIRLVECNVFIYWIRQWCIWQGGSMVSVFDKQRRCVFLPLSLSSVNFSLYPNQSAAIYFRYAYFFLLHRLSLARAPDVWLLIEIVSCYMRSTILFGFVMCVWLFPCSRDAHP